GWVARFVRRNNITLQVTNSTSTISPKLVTKSDNNSNIIDNLINRSDGNPICCNTSNMMSNSSCPLPSTASRISDLTVANANMCRQNDVTKVNATTITTTTTISTTTTTMTTATVAITTINNNSTISAKKRRKNFTPKKVVPNDRGVYSEAGKFGLPVEYSIRNTVFHVLFITINTVSYQ
ncbi:unnamed protein product, partial [Onchocerca flexuosa]|uniref:HTH CENPB-type domain-containing protein n=1 Tax=Onchocerca flexuosa TaxID=387005 RepID=A0A183HQH4_9BILA